MYMFQLGSLASVLIEFMYLFFFLVPSFLFVTSFFVGIRRGEKEHFLFFFSFEETLNLDCEDSSIREFRQAVV